MKPKQKIVAEVLEKYLCDDCAIDADGLATLVLLAIGVDERNEPSVSGNYSRFSKEHGGE